MKIEDIEENWEVDNEYSQAGAIIFKNKILPTLYRKIDVMNQTVTFTDTMRVRPERIIDINRKLSILEKATVIPQIMAVINAVRPIEFPYTPERLTIYVEVMGPYLAIYDYRLPPATVVPIHLFLEKKDGEYTEIPMWEFTEGVDNYVDQNTEQAKDN